MKKVIFSAFLVGFALSQSALAVPPNLFYGEEVLVTSSKLSMLLTKDPWSIQIIDSEQLKASDPKDLAQALAYVAGIDVKRTGALGSVSSAKIRGSTYQQVLVLIDGVRVNSPLLGGVQMEDILLDNVERIEIVRSPLSAVYGSDAVGGAINIVTKAPSEKANLSFKYENGSYGLRNYGVRVDQRLGAWNYNLVLSNILQEGYRQNSATNQLAIDGNLEGNLPFGQLSIGAKNYQAEKGIPGPAISQTDVWSATTPGDRQNDNNQSYRIALKRNGTTLRAYHNIWDQRWHGYNYDVTDYIDSSYLARETGMELDNTADFGKSKLNYGMDYRSDTGSSYFAGEHSLYNVGAYIQDQVAPNDMISFTLGLRGDHHSVTNSSPSWDKKITFNPRVGMVAAIAPQLNLRASLSQAYRAPSINELYWDDPVWNMYGNQNLKPEQNTAVEVGLLTMPSDDMEISMNFFNNDIKDLITWDWDPNTNTTEAKNSGAAAIRGWELEYKNTLSSYWKILASYTWQKGEDQGLYPGRILPYTPEKKATFGIFYTGDVFNWNLNGRYIGDRKADGMNSITLPEYSVLDFAIGVNGPRTDIKLKIENLLNAAYYETVGYSQLAHGTMPYPMPGRTISVGIGVKL
jgi:outer membrane cobalamin receptor